MKLIIAIIVILAVLALGYYFLYTKKYPSANTNSTTQNSISIAPDSVSIKDLAFDPSSITVRAGDTVTFTNNDTVTHSVIGDGGINGGDLGSGESYKETFETAGTFNYHCATHPFMEGEVVVQ